MNEHAEPIAELLRPYAEQLGMPLELATVLALGVVGAIGHFLIRAVVARFRIAAERSENPWDDVIAQSLSKPSEYAMWLVLIYLSLGALGTVEDLRLWLGQAADIGFILLLGWILHRLAASVESELLSDRRGPRDSDNRAMIAAVARLARIALWIVVVIMVLEKEGVSVSGLLAFGGIGGIAVGFAARDLLANFLGGLSIYLDRPFAVGDWIRSPDREIEGTVEHIGWRTTRIRTFDQRPLYIPNAVFSNVALENPSRMHNRRIYEHFGIRYADAGQMRAIVAAVENMLRQHDAIDLGKTLIVNFVRCAPSSLDFFVYTFTKTTDWVTYHAIKQEVLLDILDIIEAHGAEAAFPTQTLHLADDVPPPVLPNGDVTPP